MNRASAGLASLLLLVILASLASAALWSHSQSSTLLWSIPDHAADLSISGDGRTIAAAVYDPVAGGWYVKLFDNRGDLLWAWEAPAGYMVTAIDVSESGDEVTAAIYNPVSPDSRVLFWGNARSLSGSPEPAWNSSNLWGEIGAHALAISDVGDQVLMVGTGPNIMYWNNAKSKSGGDMQPDWYDYQAPWNLEHAYLSDDGDEVLAVGFESRGSSVNVYYYRNSTSATLFNDHMYTIQFYGATLESAALSPDGEYFAVSIDDLEAGGIIVLMAFDPSCPSNISMWSYSLGLNLVAADIALSLDGSTLVAAVNDKNTGTPYAIMVFRGITNLLECQILGPAGLKVGELQLDGTQSVEPLMFTGASDYTTYPFLDVSIDYSGEIIAAGTGDYVFAIRGSDASLLWAYGGDYPLVSSVVMVSSDGSYIVSGGIATDSIYFFSSTPPTIGGKLLLTEPTGLSGDVTAYIVVATVSSITIAAGLLWYRRRA